jgi:hypothetical protein
MRRNFLLIPENIKPKRRNNQLSVKTVRMARMKNGKTKIADNEPLRRKPA